MFTDNLSKIGKVEIAINVLNNALEQLNEHDSNSAQVMVAIARQMLEDLQTDFDNHCKIENMLQQVLK